MRIDSDWNWKENGLPPAVEIFLDEVCGDGDPEGVSLEDAIERVEQVRSECDGRILAMREDLRRQGVEHRPVPVVPARQRHPCGLFCTPAPPTPPPTGAKGQP